MIFSIRILIRYFFESQNNLNLQNLNKSKILDDVNEFSYKYYNAGAALDEEDTVLENELFSYPEITKNK